jgi:hypothetical protein
VSKTRVVVHVTRDETGAWNVKQGDDIIRTYERKSEAVEAGREIAKEASQGQLVIHRLDGTIQTEHTYSHDHHPPPG